MRAAGLTAGILLICTACATQFDPTDAARVHTIALAGFAEPHYDALIQFGTKDSSLEPDFSDLLAKQNFHLGAELKTAVSSELQNTGYEVIDDSKAADAVLEVSITGFPPASNPAYSAALGDFEPEFVARAKLKDVKTGKTLFSRTYVYRDNSIEPIDGSLLIRPDPKYGFSTSKALFANPQLAAEGFRAAEPLIARSIATSLKKP